jgi:hypothetical protein
MYLELNGISAFAGLLALAAAQLVACDGTQPGDEDPPIPGEAAGRIAAAMVMAGGLALEIASVVAEPPPMGGCPLVHEDGDTWSLDYGAGCTPSSGLLAEDLVGSATLTVAAGSGVFVGTLDGLGFGGEGASGGVSGNSSVAGELASADVQFDGLSWAADERENVLDGVFEGSADAASITLVADDADVLHGGDEPVFRAWLDEATVARGALGPCSIPTAGSLRLERELVSATMTFSEEAASSGSVPISYSDRDAGALALCN